jgi:hypothetical protein
LSVAFTDNAGTVFLALRGHSVRIIAQETGALPSAKAVRTSPGTPFGTEEFPHLGRAKYLDQLFKSSHRNHFLIGCSPDAFMFWLTTGRENNSRANFVYRGKP